MKTSRFAQLAAFALLLTCTVWSCEKKEIPTPTPTGGNTGTGSGNTGGIGTSPPAPTPTTGTATFFTKEDLGVGSISVTVDGKVEGTISHYHSSGVDCGQGDVNVTKAAGTYAFKATGGSLTWTGTVTIKNGSCQAQELVKSSGSTSGGTSVQGQVTFWTAQTSGWSTIDVSVGGVYAGTIKGYYTSAPSCGATNGVTINKAPGTYAFTAQSDKGEKWSGDITVTANSCATRQLTFSPSTGGTNAACDWATWNKLITVTRFEYKTNFCAEGQTLVTVRNDANVNMDIQFCIQKADGTWQSNYGLNTKPGGNLIGPDYWLCGKAKGYKFWARPTSKSSTCQYPSCN